MRHRKAPERESAARDLAGSPVPVRLGTWQRAIIGSDLPPQARLVLLVLGVHMTPGGDRCFPSVETITAETGLARSTVLKYLELTASLGWIVAVNRGIGGRGWRRHGYIPRTPEYSSGQETDREGGPVDGPTSSSKVVREASEGGPPHASKAVRQSDTNYPKNESFNSAGADARTARAAPAPAEDDLHDAAPAATVIASPAIGPDALRAWTEVRRGMRAELGEATYATWIAPLRLEAISPDFVLSAPGKFHRDRVRSLHEATLRHRLRAAFGTERPIEWRVRPEPAEPLSTPSTRDGGAWT